MHIEERRTIQVATEPAEAIRRIVELATTSGVALAAAQDGVSHSASGRRPFTSDPNAMGGEEFVSIAAVSNGTGGSRLTITVGWDLPETAGPGYSYAAKNWVNGLARGLTQELGSVAFPQRGDIAS